MPALCREREKNTNFRNRKQKFVDFKHRKQRIGKSMVMMPCVLAYFLVSEPKDCHVSLQIWSDCEYT
jgi:hypothetical protein